MESAAVIGSLQVVLASRLKAGLPKFELQGADLADRSIGIGGRLCILFPRSSARPNLQPAAAAAAATTERIRKFAPTNRKPRRAARTDNKEMLSRSYCFCAERRSQLAATLGSPGADRKRAAPADQLGRGGLIGASASDRKGK